MRQTFKLFPGVSGVNSFFGLTTIISLYRDPIVAEHGRASPQFSMPCGSISMDRNTGSGENDLGVATLERRPSRRKFNRLRAFDRSSASA